MKPSKTIIVTPWKETTEIWSYPWNMRNSTISLKDSHAHARKDWKGNSGRHSSKSLFIKYSYRETSFSFFFLIFIFLFLFYFTYISHYDAELKMLRSRSSPPLIGANFSVFGMLEKVCPFKKKSSPKFIVAWTLKLHLDNALYSIVTITHK